MRKPYPLPPALLLAALTAAVLSACGGSDDVAVPPTIPSAPVGMGSVDSAPVADAATVPAFVDFVATNQRGDARYATKETNAGVRVLTGMLDIWQPSTLLVDAGAAAPANGNFPAVPASTWSGTPGDATDGKVLNKTVHDANIGYVADVTGKRTPAQELAAYLDDRRGKAYSVSDGMGPLTEAWRAAAQQTTSITAIASDATTVLYNDSGNNTGVAGSANAQFGTVVDFMNSIGSNGSTEPSKRYYKYARPWRWSSSVKVVPALEPAKSATPTTDGGFISGHTAEAVRNSIAMAYVVPERYQEMLARGLELGENRILAGMHSPLDVIGGRILGTSVAAASLLTADSNGNRKASAYQQAHTALMAASKTTTLQAFNDFAHSGTAANDRFADYAANKAGYQRRLTFGLPQIADKTRGAAVPKGAEVLLETRLPYLDANQRRVVLKTTAVASGYPVMDDVEGWGRLNLFAAADGYGRFDGDVTVSMDATLGGFNALDSWRNDIAGAGKLTKQGSGTLRLAGSNSYSGGTDVQAGTVEGDSVAAFGKGDVYVRTGGSVVINAADRLGISGNYTQQSGSTLTLRLGAGNTGTLAVGKLFAIVGGTLQVSFQGGYKPKVGDTLTIVTSGNQTGKFDKVVVDGFNATASYSSSGVTLKINS
ncbi:acid phosphatase [Chitinimonas sp.]|uniref:acid phosphatase n=1 Tax=Chitinimonas sp. TaxID=1934313 RepID=UPI002F9554F4